VPSVGVSNEPEGAAACAPFSDVNVTVIGPAVLPAPVKVSVMLPVCVGERPDAKCVAIVNVAEPLPEVGATTSHGVVEAAVQVTVPAPVCVRRTVCADVWALNAAPVVTALKTSDVRSRDISGAAPADGSV
jgi:hypothetical protein